MRRAAFSGAPARVLAVLPGDGSVPAWLDPPRPRWLAGVSLGALGRYEQARRLLLPGGEPADSAAASARASHLRQLGRHAEAEPLDVLALDTVAGARPAGWVAEAP